MTEQLCDFLVCKLAKEKGFDIPCSHAWEWYVHEGKEHGPIAIPVEVPMLSSLFEALLKLSPEEREGVLKRPGLFEGGAIKNVNYPPYLYARPSQSLLVRWLREKHRINVNVYPDLDNWEINIYSLTERECIWHSDEENMKDPEAALELGLLTALSFIK